MSTNRSDHARAADLGRRRGEHGASAAEYALLVAAIATLIVLMVFTFGRTVNDLYSSSCDEVATTAAATSDCD